MGTFKTKFNNIINPPEVKDPTDPGIGHLIGLMFHRAWTLKEIAIKEGFRTMSDMGRELILSGDLNFREFDRVLSME